MPMRIFTAALTIGSVPAAFAFAAIGADWADQPALALAVSYMLPILLLPVALYLMRLRASKKFPHWSSFSLSPRCSPLPDPCCWASAGVVVTLRREYVRMAPTGHSS